MSECRSCGAEIQWAQTRNGKRMPLDAEPVDEGEWGLDENASPPLAVRVRDELPGSFRDTYKCHFETCPNADQHRRPRAQAAPVETCPKCRHRFVGKRRNA